MPHEEAFFVATMEEHSELRPQSTLSLEMLPVYLTIINRIASWNLFRDHLTSICIPPRQSLLSSAVD